MLGRVRQARLPSRVTSSGAAGWAASTNKWAAENWLVVGYFTLVWTFHTWLTAERLWHSWPHAKHSQNKNMPHTPQVYVSPQHTHTPEPLNTHIITHSDTVVQHWNILFREVKIGCCKTWLSFHCWCVCLRLWLHQPWAETRSSLSQSLMRKWSWLTSDQPSSWHQRLSSSSWRGGPDCQLHCLTDCLTVLLSNRPLVKSKKAPKRMIPITTMSWQMNITRRGRQAANHHLASAPVIIFACLLNKTVTVHCKINSLTIGKQISVNTPKIKCWYCLLYIKGRSQCSP